VKAVDGSETPVNGRDQDLRRSASTAPGNESSEPALETQPAVRSELAWAEASLSQALKDVARAIDAEVVNFLAAPVADSRFAKDRHGAPEPISTCARFQQNRPISACGPTTCGASQLAVWAGDVEYEEAGRL